MYMIVKSLCCTPEINIILYVNYTSIKCFKSKCGKKDPIDLLVYQVRHEIKC